MMALSLSTADNTVRSFSKLKRPKRDKSAHLLTTTQAGNIYTEAVQTFMLGNNN